MEGEKSEDGNGGVKLPIGFRFHPTDEELLIHYLRRKVFSLPLPANVIPELDVFQTNPWDLPGELKEKRYFFCKRGLPFMKTCIKFSTDFGYWKSTEKKNKQIMAPGSDLIIGIKKSFIFYQGRKLKTQWVVREFSLVGSINTPYSTQKLMMQVGDWVVCRLYQRKRKATNGGIMNQLGRNLQGMTACDCLNPRIGSENGPRASPSSCSSGITEVSCSELDEEASSEFLHL